MERSRSADRGAWTALPGVLALAVGLSGCVTIDLPGGRPGPLVETVLEHTGGNQSKAADILGVTRSTLRTRIKRYGL